MKKLKPTNEQLTRAARLYNHWKANKQTAHKAGYLVLWFMDYYRASLKDIKLRAKFIKYYNL
ncbi:MAG: hypothetical protein BGN92_07135 [Sphingobacteriales bacterium 41-5]|nr:MAG: hypothetical protein BGN92_07135 [Sphingobacteriales bacterium 41-5]